MAIPISTSFTLFDWNPAGVAIDDETSGLLQAAAASRGAPYVDAASGRVRLLSTDGVPSRVVLPLHVPSKYSLEARVRLDALPVDFADPSSKHVFLGVVNPQGGAAGLLLAQSGVAVVGDPQLPVAALSGSSGLTVLGDDITFRILVNGTAKTASLYLTLTSALPTTGHVLRHSVRLPQSAGMYGDALVLETVGSGVGAGDVSIFSLRMADGALTPNKRPVAVVTADQTTSVGRLVVLDGTGSYDPEGASLSYAWTVTRQPAGGAALSGVTTAVASHGGVTFSAATLGSAGTGVRIAIVDPGLDPENDALLLSVDEDGVVQVVLRHVATDFTGRTTDGDLVSAFTRPNDPAYSAAVAALVTAELTGDAVAVTGEAELTLAGGVDSADASPVFFVEGTGTFEAQLVVNDGELDSAPATVTVSCLGAAVEVGRVPDAGFVWGYLSDFFGLVKGRERLEVLWSGLIQIVGAELLRLKQVDYSKSLADIQPRMQHKWCGYPARYSPAGTLTLRRPAVVSARPLAVGAALRTPTLLLEGALPDDVVPGDVVAVYTDVASAVPIRSYDPLRLYSQRCRITAGVTEVVVLDGGLLAAGVRSGDPVVVVTPSGEQVPLRARRATSDTTLEVWDVPLVTVESPAEASVYVGGVLTLAEDVAPVYEVIDAGDGTAQPVYDGDDVDATTIFGVAYGALSADITTGDLLEVGDMRLEIVDRTGTTLVVSAALLSITRDRLASWRVLRSTGLAPAVVRVGPHFTAGSDVECLSESDFAILSGEEGQVTGWVAAVSGPYVAIGADAAAPAGSTSVSFLRTTRLPVRETTLAIPRLQAHGGAPSTYYRAGVDYHISGQSIVWARETATAAWVAGSSVAELDVLTDAGGCLYVMEGPDRGVYPIVGRNGRVVTVDHAFTADAPGAAVAVLSGGADSVPEIWWAEYTYEDNWPVIENNFGLLVGMPHDAFSALSGGSYLSAVRALHFALWAGPRVSSLRLGGQVVLGLPFAEVAGEIIAINPLFSESQGRILVADDTDASVVRAYRYPLSAGVATNPDTGAEYAVGDVVPAFAVLSNGVRVQDYVNAPSWYSGVLQGAQELRKFHTFRVEVDLTAVQDTSAFGLLVQYLDRAAPAHTDYLLVGVREVADDISVTSQIGMTAGIAVRDGYYVTPDGDVATGTVVGATATTLELDAGAVAVDDVYVGMRLRITAGDGDMQAVDIVAYDGATHTATVAGWSEERGAPSAGSEYAITNPPPFVAGAFQALDYYDGRGSWDPDAARMYWPCFGEPPTALVVPSAVFGIFTPGERVNVASRFVGVVRRVHERVMYLDVIGGSVPIAGDTLTGRRSGATMLVASASLGAWPTYAYVSRDRSEVWIPLDPETLLGPEDGSGIMQAYNSGTPSVTLALAASAQDDAYVNWMLRTDVGFRRIVSYVGSTRVATLASAYPSSPGAVYILHPPKPICRLRNMDFFEPGTQVVGATSGHTAYVKSFGPAYLRLVNPSHAPYSSFVRGEVLYGVGNVQATALDEPFYVRPDYLSALDRRGKVGPASAVSCRLCFAIGADGQDPALDMGLIMDDVELFQRPFDADVPRDEQYVPSHGPGLYWWAGYKLVYGHVDATPAGPGPEPAWLPSPAVPAGALATDPGWKDGVLHDIVICRAVSADPTEPVSMSPVPDPVITDIA